MAPRLIRRRPLLERIKAYLDPIDFLLWLHETADAGEWDSWQQQWALPAGISLNLILLAARANSGLATDSTDDLVFGNDDGHVRWSAWFVRAQPLHPIQ